MWAGYGGRLHCAYIIDLMLYPTHNTRLGYGRGSKKLGVPTANLPESLFAEVTICWFFFF